MAAICQVSCRSADRRAYTSLREGKKGREERREQSHAGTPYWSVLLLCTPTIRQCASDADQHDDVALAVNFCRQEIRRDICMDAASVQEIRRDICMDAASVQEIQRDICMDAASVHQSFKIST